MSLHNNASSARNHRRAIGRRRKHSALIFVQGHRDRHILAALVLHHLHKLLTSHGDHLAHQIQIDLSAAHNNIRLLNLDQTLNNQVLQHFLVFVYVLGAQFGETILGETEQLVQKVVASHHASLVLSTNLGGLRNTLLNLEVLFLLGVLLLYLHLSLLSDRLTVEVKLLLSLDLDLIGLFDRLLLDELAHLINALLGIGSTHSLSSLCEDCCPIRLGKRSRGNRYAPIQLSFRGDVQWKSCGIANKQGRQEKRAIARIECCEASSPQCRIESRRS